MAARPWVPSPPPVVGRALALAWAAVHLGLYCCLQYACVSRGEPTVEGGWQVAVCDLAVQRSRLTLGGSQVHQQLRVRTCHGPRQC